MTIPFLQPVIGSDMNAVDRVLRDALDSDVVLIRQVAEHIIGGGGKRDFSEYYVAAYDGARFSRRPPSKRPRRSRRRPSRPQ